MRKPEKRLQLRILSGVSYCLYASHLLKLFRIMERETGIEPATNSLEGCDSTTELLPLVCVFNEAGSFVMQPYGLNLAQLAADRSAPDLQTGAGEVVLKLAVPRGTVRTCRRLRVVARSYKPSRESPGISWS
jgi:hypothetical protein